MADEKAKTEDTERKRRVFQWADYGDATGSKCFAVLCLVQKNTRPDPRNPNGLLPAIVRNATMDPLTLSFVLNADDEYYDEKLEAFRRYQKRYPNLVERTDGGFNHSPRRPGSVETPAEELVRLRAAMEKSDFFKKEAEAKAEKDAENIALKAKNAELEKRLAALEAGARTKKD